MHAGFLASSIALTAIKSCLLAGQHKSSLMSILEDFINGKNVRKDT